MNIKPSIDRGIGSLVAAFESWITPKFNVALHKSFSSPKLDEASREHAKQPGERLGENADYSITSDSSNPTSCAGNLSTEILLSTSTAPSFIFSGQSGLIKRPIDHGYRPNVPNIQESDEEGSFLLSRDLNGAIEQSPELLRATSNTSRPGAIDDAVFLVETKADEIIEEKATGAAGNISGDVADTSYVDGIDNVTQTQRDCELADQEAAAEAQQSYDQLVRMQREFDEESTRLRADREMALEYARGLEEAMRVDGTLRAEEAILQQDLELAERLQSEFLKEEEHREQDLQAAVNFARSLEEADTLENAAAAMQTVIDTDSAFAAQLMEEETDLENDRALARQLQAEWGKEEAFAAESDRSREYPNRSIDRPNSDNYSTRAIPASRLSSTYADKLGSPPLKYHRFPSLESIRGSARVSWNDKVKADRTQKPGVAMPYNGAAAQALFANEQMRYAEADERWKRNIQAWQETNKTKAEAVTARHARLENVQERARRTPTERPEVMAARMSFEKDVADCSICVESIPKSRLVRPCKDFYCRPCLTG